MPILTVTPKKVVELQHDALEKLNKRCLSCYRLRNQTADTIFVYSISMDYESPDGQAMLAIAKYDNNTYAIHPADYLTDEQYEIFSFFLRDIEDGATFVVFSQKSFDAIKKYSYDKKNIKVRLCLY